MEDTCYWMIFCTRPINFVSLDNTDLFALKTEIEDLNHQFQELIRKYKWQIVIINGDITIAILYPKKKNYNKIVDKLLKMQCTASIKTRYNIILERIGGIEEVTNAYVFQKLNQSTIENLIESINK